MAQSTTEAVELREAISRALKTTVREGLALACKKLFTAEHPGEKHYEVLCSSKEAIKVLKSKPFLRESIRSKEIEDLDVTALYVVLREVCGLASNRSVWKDPSSLEGNIDILRNLRNDDAHNTGPADKDLEDTWRQMDEALTNVLQMTDLQDHLDEYKKKLENNRKPKLAKVTDRKKIRDRIKRELQELYKSGRKTSLMPLVWSGRHFPLHHPVEDSYTRTKFSITDHGKLREIDGDSVLDEVGSHRPIIVQGESGTGKTSLLRHYASCWAGGAPSPLQPLANVDYLLFLDCTAVSTRTFTPSDIIQEILPDTYSIWRPGAIIKELSKAGDKVMFLIDAFDERLDAFRVAFETLQLRCSGASFVVTTRPHCTLAISKLCQSKPVVVTTHGFTRSNAIEYAKRLIRTCGKTVDVDAFFATISPYDELMSIPQLLCFSLWFWMEEGAEHFSTRGRVFASITDYLLRKLCHISGTRVLSGKLPPMGQRWLSAVARLAFSQAKHKSTLLTQSSDEIESLLETAKELKLLPLEALSTLLQCTSSMKSQGEHITFQFVHESHANFLAALHITETLQSSKISTLAKLLKDLQAERKKSIISFTVSLIFKDGTPVDKRIMQDFVRESRPYVKFYDITFLLDLIEESGYSIKLARQMAKEVSEGLCETSTTSPATESPEDCFPQLFRGQVWLRPKEFRRGEALSMFLSQAKPERLWLRLSEGPRSNEESPVCGRKAVEGDPVAAMRLVSQSYSRSVLIELRLTDVTIATPLTWPKILWWLSLERCHIQCDLALPPWLLKVSIIDCTGERNVKLPTGLKNLKLENANLDDLQVPGSVETATLHDCTFTDSAPFSVRYGKVHKHPRDAQLDMIESGPDNTAEPNLVDQPGLFMDKIKELRERSILDSVGTSRLAEASSGRERISYTNTSATGSDPESFSVTTRPAMSTETGAVIPTPSRVLDSRVTAEEPHCRVAETITRTGAFPMALYNMELMRARVPRMWTPATKVPGKKIATKAAETKVIKHTSRTNFSKNATNTITKTSVTKVVTRTSKTVTKDASRNRVTKNTPGTSVTKKAFGASMTKNTPGTSVTKKAFGTSMTKNTPGTSVTKKAFGTSMTKNTPGTSMTKKAFGASMTKNTPGTSMAKKAFGTSVTAKAPRTSVAKKAFGTSETKKAFGTNVTTKALGTSVAKKASGGNLNKKTPGTRKATNAAGIKKAK